MLSEAIHSLADSGEPDPAAGRQQAGQRRRSTSHQFGYGRVRYVYGFLVAIVLFLVGGLFSLYEGFHKIQHPEELDSPIVAFVVLLIAIGLEGLLVAHRSTGGQEAERKSRSLFRFVQRHRQPGIAGRHVGGHRGAGRA